MIIAQGEHDHVELADMLHGAREGQGLSRSRLLVVLKEHLREIGRPDLIRGERINFPT